MFSLVPPTGRFQSSKCQILHFVAVFPSDCDETKIFPPPVFNPPLSLDERTALQGPRLSARCRSDLWQKHTV